MAQLKGFEFVATLALVFKKIESEDKTKYGTFLFMLMTYLSQPILKLYHTSTKIWGKGSDWIIDSVIDHDINISEYNPLNGSSYINLMKELDHLRKGLINIQNIDDNECFKGCLGRSLHPADHYPE